ncbi:low molecular weight protein-tyrosine-phosphatase [Streptomyces sp. NPDC005012]|uniref:low molecular weight protein-tyrosine-phosphatase n=1 Tax=unclassified Streptomyces TaxID=2593676 RepID=UPI0033A096B4
MHLTFVCSGNICRSPSAALVVGERLRRAGLGDRVRVTSAGIGDWHVGEPVDPRSGAALAGRGYPTGHSAAQVGAEHLDADLFVAMDRTHEKALRGLVDDPTRIRLMRSFDPEAVAAGDLEVPDPYYGGEQGFEDVLDMIEACVPGLLAWVRERLDG